MLASSDSTEGGGRSDVAPATRSGVTLKLFGRFRFPVYLAAAPRDRRRLFVVELKGRVLVVRDGRRLRRPFLDLRSRVGIGRTSGGLDHGGLFSIAFPPDYSRTRRFYVFYTHRRGSLQVEEFRRSRSSRDRADPRSGRVVIAVPKASHFDLGGQIAFGPDGLLYIGIGYGPDAAAAQDLTALRGKLLRISPTRTDGAPYRVPGSNPFVGRPGVRPEIFASGLRNPWRFSFDRRSGTIAIGDLGERDVEEINFLPLARAAGANFGWDLLEGNKRRRAGNVLAYAPPALQYGHDRGACGVIGGRVVRSRSLRSLRRRYLYTDLCTGRLRSARVVGGRLRGDRRERLRVPNPVAFGVDARGRVYVVSLNGGVYRLVQR
jgi:glucose/arabinose dehydrogenase